MTDPNGKSISHVVLIKVAAMVLAFFFLTMAALFLSDCFISVAGTIKGRDAKILAVSSSLKNCPTACRFGGLFEATIALEKNKTEKVYCLYPAWPDMLRPLAGDVIRVWPEQQPVVGAVPVDGWGWFIVGSLLVVGFIMVEFAFLALTIR